MRSLCLQFLLKYFSTCVSLIGLIFWSEALSGWVLPCLLHFCQISTSCLQGLIYWYVSLLVLSYLSFITIIFPDQIVYLAWISLFINLFKTGSTNSDSIRLIFHVLNHFMAKKYLTCTGMISEFKLRIARA